MKNIPHWALTVVGALATAFGYVSQPQVLSVLPPKWAAIITAVGGVLIACGVTKAQTVTHNLLSNGAH